MAPLQVVLASYELGLGGTEKSLVNHALAFDRDRVQPRIVAIRRGGARAAALEAAQIPVDSADGDQRRLVELLRGADIVHVYRSGGTEPLLPSAVREAGVPVLVEMNVFGHLDESADEAQFACHLFMSQMCAMRYRRWIGLEPAEFFSRHRVLHNPIDLRGIRAVAPEPREARLRLGLDPERPVVARVGRADDRKWAPIVIDMLPELLRLVPGTQVMLVGVTAATRARLMRRGLLDRVRIEEPRVEEEGLATFYRAADVLVTASSIGESFGVAIAEAMTLGVPVVTTSTPWVDNAQVELVEHGVTGFIANHPRSFAEAVADLLGNQGRRSSFGGAAAAKATACWDAAVQTRRLEDLYEALVRTGAPCGAWWPDVRDLEEFEASYAEMSAAQYRRLNVFERLQVGAAVARERAAWLINDLREAPRERIPVVLAMARARARQARPRKASHTSAGNARNWKSRDR